MNISLYDCGSFPLGKIIPAIVQRIDWKTTKIVILAQNEEIVHEVDKFLWTFTPLMFIPHATTFDPQEIKDNSPIMISYREEDLVAFDQDRVSNYIFINTLPDDMSSFIARKTQKDTHLIFVLNSSSALDEKFSDLRTMVIDSLQNTTLPFRWWVYKQESWVLNSDEK